VSEPTLEEVENVGRVFARVFHKTLATSTKLVVIGITDEGLAWIMCGLCGMVSYNRTDIAQLYCGHCHKFHLEP
jgi:hypothetical protein